MNKFGWFFEGLMIGSLIVTIMIGIKFGFNNKFILPIILSCLAIIFSPIVYREKELGEMK
jgi:hypothetical protein